MRSKIFFMPNFQLCCFSMLIAIRFCTTKIDQIVIILAVIYGSMQRVVGPISEV